MTATYLDRTEAGIKLAAILQTMNLPKETIVLALPRGGVPVGFEIAKKLNLPLDITLVRKLGAPNYKEYAIGAIAQNNIMLLNDEAIQMLHVSKGELEAIVSNEEAELKRRAVLYRGNKPWLNLKDKTVIIVDDGIATGFTIKAAIDSIKLSKPKKIIVAVPVASKEAINEIDSKVDQIICPIIPENFYAVGAWYEHFPQTTDEEVCELLDSASI